MRFPKANATQWHAYFAWLPTSFYDDNNQYVTVWLEKVERKLTFVSPNWVTNYRLIEAKAQTTAASA